MRSKIRTTVLFTALFLVAAGLAQADQTQAIPVGQRDSQRLERVPVDIYEYRMKLDIARVLSSSDTSRVCGVVPTVMHYEDSQGELRALEYLVHGGGCSDN
ncbi:DUF2790 domain-containing protein [Pseudomonas sp. GD03696]|uniref:DUF2790 domain-containing protein n=1 Tax=Pseudomonas sp. GD03696 TaxID=2975368 RepID=UPI00244A8EFC|nr:DUF2790 domain-containing protein [Pseudomonas sp. GD03696]MDH1932806.1 DUF2790 domain-containing protein [Pseudomonas sp. GD03696]